MKGGEIASPEKRLFHSELDNDNPIIFSIRNLVLSDKDIKILNSENSDGEKEKEKRLNERNEIQIESQQRVLRMGPSMTTNIFPTLKR
ncbi:hypothetical protein TNCV_464891 [Trichonephila clavipes]|nr:hypothetical protein TNCV_464891 [Trichonephila clavipes]